MSQGSEERKREDMIKARVQLVYDRSSYLNESNSEKVELELKDSSSVVSSLCT